MKKFALAAAITLAATSSFAADTNTNTNTKEWYEGLGLTLGYAAVDVDGFDSPDTESNFTLGANYTFENGLLVGFDYAPGLFEDSASAFAPGASASISLEADALTTYVGYQAVNGVRGGLGLTFVTVEANASLTNAFGSASASDETDGTLITPFVGYKFANNMTVDGKIAFGDVDGTDMVITSIAVGYVF
ncbi:outer membrane beta-barrel protein [Vibrio panuliri]|uniref:Outer membrane protein beta-barrel domain-containing protein n=1 Tax=Vibrio panuliri TaxID=1381081 RepID=A0ABX3FSN9_9VIBR|nr:outer membrane beta-barrel protein [Vibrio panuliri]KAB1457160.1 outer membrane beta-barrel protein [Vibrio panuliri]OLQ96219.1 hypothetical protein BIY20_19770 [Vibrio panuliri]